MRLKLSLFVLWWGTAFLADNMFIQWYDSRRSKIFKKKKWTTHSIKPFKYFLVYRVAYKVKKHFFHYSYVIVWNIKKAKQVIGVLSERQQVHLWYTPGIPSNLPSLLHDPTKIHYASFCTHKLSIYVSVYI